LGGSTDNLEVFFLGGGKVKFTVILAYWYGVGCILRMVCQIEKGMASLLIGLGPIEIIAE